MADGEGEDDGLEERVLALAAGGLGRVEIAAALGLGEAELTALEGARPALALAMRRARALERAWWEGPPAPLARVNIPYNGRPRRTVPPRPY